MVDASLFIDPDKWLAEHNIMHSDNILKYVDVADYHAHNRKVVGNFRKQKS